MTTTRIDKDKLKLLYQEDDRAFYEYRPTLSKCLYIDFQKMRLSRRMRLMLEWLNPRHYLVYYLAINEELVGYCIVAPGGRRLKCSTDKDIVIGPYYIVSTQRGKGYSKEIIALTLKYCNYTYETAYDYISKTNTPSIRATESCGFTSCGELNIIGRFHKLIEVPTGDGTHLIYKLTKEDMKV